MSFRFVSLYVLIYLVTTFGFIILMFGILTTEIENNIKREITRDYRDAVQNIDPKNAVEIESRISSLTQSVNALEIIYILKTPRKK